MKCFRDIADEMRRHEMNLPSPRVEIRIPEAEDVLRQALAFFLEQNGHTLQWLPEYAEVGRWLAGNEGRGLFLFGSCGRGKSMLCRYVLPAILFGYYRRVVSVFDTVEMNSRIDYVLSRHIISLDDIGTEEVSYQYGNKRLAFAEIMDAAEKHNKLLIISTNLSVEEIRSRYGERVLDRIRSTTRRVLFEGKSLRK